MTTSTTYRPGQSVTLPARFQAEPDVTLTATIRFVDEIDRLGRRLHAGHLVRGTRRGGDPMSRKDDKDFDTREDVFKDWVRNGSDIQPTKCAGRIR